MRGGVATLIAGNVAAGATGELAEVADVVINDPGLINNLVFSGDNSRPKAYIHYLYFDKDYNYQSGGMAQVSTTTGAFQELSLQFTAEREGYVLVYTANQTAEDLDVFIDDLLVEHIESPVIRTDDYYPFGLAFNSSQRTGVLTNKYLYNGIELQSDLGWDNYLAEYRSYNPTIGRWQQIDPKSEQYFSWGVYVGMGDNPISIADPLGDKWKTDSDEDKAERMKELYENRKNALSEKIKTFKSKIDKQEEKGEKANKDKINDWNAIISDLESQKAEVIAGQTEIDKLGKSKIEFTLKEVEGSAGATYREGSTIVLEYNGDALLAHELVHGFQIHTGKIGATPGGLFFKKITNTESEVQAFKRQYAVSGSSLPPSEEGDNSFTPKQMRSINGDYIKGIYYYDEKGEKVKPYENYQ